MVKLAPELPNRLMQARKMADFTQEQLAVAANISRQTVGAIEKGKYNPSTLLALRFAALLETSVEELFWLSQESIEELEKHKRKLGIVQKGGK